MKQFHDQEHRANWPTRDILSLGYFGSGTPEGLRFRNRSLSALALLVICTVLLARIEPIIPVQVLRSALPGVIFGYIGWEWWRYIAHLDELARRLQVEAMAWTYIFGVFAAMALGGVCLFLHWNLNPGIFISLELVRAVRLWILARRF